jgi:hypothetical protein
MLLKAVQQRGPRMFDVIRKTHTHLVHHTQKSKNFGRLGGNLIVELLTYANGDPTGYTYSRVVYL